MDLRYNMKSAVVIIPTTGADTLAKTIDSVAKQSYKNLTALVVIDGKQNAINKFVDGEQIASIPLNPDNTDYQQYLKWVEAGNTPLPADGE